MSEKVERTDDEWRRLLSQEEYWVSRRGATERPFSGRYWNCGAKGTYHCVCCGQPLFTSESKFDSGSGWPSFFAPVDAGAVVCREDRSHGMLRTEVLCSRCDAHLGHVFEDGPPPTGLRYCINSLALRLKTDGAER